MTQKLLSGLAAVVLAPCFAWGQGNPLGPEFRVNTYTTGVQRFPEVAAVSSGDFVVVWHSAQDGSSFGVIGQRYAAGGTPLGAEFRVNTYTSGSQSLASVAPDGAGRFVVVWQSNNQDGSSYGIFGQRFDGSGLPIGSAFRANTYTTNAQFRPSMAVHPSGSFVVAWESFGQDSSGRGLFGQRFAADGTALGPEFAVNTYTTGDQQYASVAMDASGNFVVAWQSYGQDGSDRGVFAQRYGASGGSLGPEFQVSVNTTGAQFLPAVAAVRAGGFVVVWADTGQYGCCFEVFGRRYATSGSPLGAPFRVNTYTTNAQSSPALAVDASGNFVVVWTSYFQDGSYRGIFGQRYASSGAPEGPEFRVNTYTTSFQLYPSVSADPSGNFLVVWESNAQDGSDFGVFGQRFSQIVPVELMRFAVE